MSRRDGVLDESGSLWISSSVEVLGGEWNGNCFIKSIRFSPDCRVRVLGNSDFSCCINLSSVYIPPSVERIGWKAFGSCTALTEVIFADNSCLKSISGFGECSSLCRLEIPSSVEVIGPSAFWKCMKLTEVSFASDSHVRVISGFRGCASLCRLDLPVSLEEIGVWAFGQCEKLTEVVFAAEGRLKSIKGFPWCSSLCRLEIPASVEVIDLPAFEQCTSLREVTFAVDSHLRLLGGFCGCVSLHRMEIPASVEEICVGGGLGISGAGFLAGVWRPELILASGTRIKTLPGNGDFWAFMTFADEEDVKKHRRRVHLRSFGVH
jgi:hypothetical protein